MIDNISRTFTRGKVLPCNCDVGEYWGCPGTFYGFKITGITIPLREGGGGGDKF